MITSYNWYSDFVPISLLVTLEIIKFFQAFFIATDVMLLDMDKDMLAKVQSSNLNEELGQIEYVFSDKTGTLTQNIMEFKKMWVGNYSYGRSDVPKLETFPTQTSSTSNNDSDFLEEHKLNDQMGKMSTEKREGEGPRPMDPDITNVAFHDPVFYEHMEDPSQENNDRIHRFLIHLAVCHTVIIDKQELEDRVKITYNAR